MPRQLHKSVKRFSFEDENQSSSPLKKEAKKGKFNFNDFADSDEQENQPARSKQQNFMNTVDTLNDRTEPPRQVESILGPSTQEPANLSSNTQQQLTKAARKEKEIIDQGSLRSYIHPEEVNYIEGLFQRLLNQEQDLSLHELIRQLTFSRNDRLAKQQALMYLLINSILNDKFDYTINNAYTHIEKNRGNSGDIQLQLKKWAIFALRRKQESSKIPLEKNKEISQEWLMIAENRIHQLVKRFIDKQDYDEAILVSNLQDKAFIESFEIGQSKILKYQYSRLQIKNIKITPNISWIVDFSIVAQYFDTNLMSNYLFDICNKYQATSNSPKSTLLPPLVALTLHFSEGQEAPKLQRILEKIILQQKRLCYLDQILYLHILKQYKRKYSRLFNKLTQTLIPKIHNPQLFVSLMEFSEFSEEQIKSSINLLFEKNQNISAKKEQSIQRLFIAIEGKTRIEGLETAQAIHLYNWMQCQKYLRLVANKKHTEAAVFYSNAYSSIKKSKIHSSKYLNQSLVQNIVKFQLACSYKQSQRSEYYRILQKLKSQLQGDHNTTIIQGCMAFVQLKANAVWLHDQDKLHSLHELFIYLKSLRSDKASIRNANCFLTNICKTLENILLSFQGQILLGQLANKIPERNNRQKLAKCLEKENKQRELKVDPIISKSPYFVLLQLVNWNANIVNFIIIKLLFS